MAQNTHELILYTLQRENEMALVLDTHLLESVPLTREGSECRLIIHIAERLATALACPLLKKSVARLIDEDDYDENSWDGWE